MPMAARRVLSFPHAVSLLLALTTQVGCISSGRYYMAQESWDLRETQPPGDDLSLAVPAQEALTDRQVWLKVGALQRGQLVQTHGCRVLVEARAPNSSLSLSAGFALSSGIAVLVGGVLLALPSEGPPKDGWRLTPGNDFGYKVLGGAFFVGGALGLVVSGILAGTGTAQRPHEIQPTLPGWTYRKESGLPCSPASALRPGGQR